MNDYSHDSVHVGLTYIENTFIVRYRNAAWVCQLVINDWLEHGDSEINGEDWARWVFKRSFSKWATVSEKQSVVLLRKDHWVWTFKWIAVKVLYYRSNLNPIISYGLTQDSLMSLVCNEATALVVEYQACRLPTCRWNWFDTTAFFVNTEDVAISAYAKQITVSILSWAEEGNR